MEQFIVGMYVYSFFFLFYFCYFFFFLISRFSVKRKRLYDFLYEYMGDGEVLWIKRLKSFCEEKRAVKRMDVLTIVYNRGNMQAHFISNAGPIPWTFVLQFATKMEWMVRHGGVGLGRYRCWYVPLLSYLI